MISLVRAGVRLFRRMRLAGLGREPRWRTVGDGLRMLIDPGDWMDREFYLGVYDPWLLHVIRRVVRPGDVCLDVGAHKGYVAMHLARRVGPDGRVFAFEPDPRARGRLEEHSRTNGLTQMSVVPHALGESRSSMTFALSHQLGWSSLFPNTQAAATVAERITIDVRSVDQMIRDGELEIGTERLSFVKIDAEGAEPLVLAGMKDLLARSRPVIWLEINRTSLAAAGRRATDVSSLLTELGFRLYFPRRGRRLGRPRVVLEPLVRIDSREEEMFDVLAAHDPPTTLAQA